MRQEDGEATGGVGEVFDLFGRGSSIDDSALAEHHVPRISPDTNADESKRIELEFYCLNYDVIARVHKRGIRPLMNEFMVSCSSAFPVLLSAGLPVTFCQ